MGAFEAGHSADRQKREVDEFDPYRAAAKECPNSAGRIYEERQDGTRLPSCLLTSPFDK